MKKPPSPKTDIIKGAQVSDLVYTHPDLAKKIINYFKPTGKCLDPCKGKGAFYDNLPSPKDWCEIQDGKDCLDYNETVDWIITNPPYSGKAYRAVGEHCFKIAENVVFLTRFDRALTVSFARHQDFLKHNHSIKEIILMPFNDAKFTDHNGKELKSGYILAIIHWKKNYAGDCKWTYWL